MRASMSSRSSNGSIKAKGPALTTACVAVVPCQVKATIGFLPEGASGVVEGGVKLSERDVPLSYRSRQAGTGTAKKPEPNSADCPQAHNRVGQQIPADPSTEKWGAEYGASSHCDGAYPGRTRAVRHTCQSFVQMAA